MVNLRRQVDQLCADRDDVRVEHRFDVSGAFGLPSDDSGGAVYGWGTTMEPTAAGTPLWIWFDGFDEDLAVMIEDKHWFEWLDISDEDAVVAEVTGLCAGVLAGQLWEWKTRGARGCDVMLPDGRTLTVTQSRLRLAPWLNRDKVLFRRKLSAYGPPEPTEI
jgi:hypothetical protein